MVHTAPERMVCEAASYVFGELMRATAGFPSETCVRRLLAAELNDRGVAVQEEMPVSLLARTSSGRIVVLGSNRIDIMLEFPTEVPSAYCSAALGLELKVGPMGQVARASALAQTRRYCRQLGVDFVLLHFQTTGVTADLIRWQEPISPTPGAEPTPLASESN